MSRAEATQRNLLNAAERLFASRGVDGVTVSDITAAAGAANNSAVAYHFGSKEALVREVMKPHLTAIDEERDRMLSELEGADPPTLRTLVECLVLPFAGCLRSASGRRFLQIQAWLVGLPSASRLPTSVKRPWDREGSKRIAALIADAVGSRSEGPENLEDRVLLTRSLILHGLADFARSNKAGDEGRDRFVGALVDAVVAIL